MVLSADVGFRPSIGGAHSTFVETLLSVGAIGLILLLAVVVFNVGRVWWQALGGQSWAMGWWAAVSTFALMENGLDGQYHRSDHGRVPGAVLQLHVPVARPKHSTRPMSRTPLLCPVA